MRFVKRAAPTLSKFRKLRGYADPYDYLSLGVTNLGLDTFSYQKYSPAPLFPLPRVCLQVKVTILMFYYYSPRWTLDTGNIQLLLVLSG